MLLKLVAQSLQNGLALGCSLCCFRVIPCSLSGKLLEDLEFGDRVNVIVSDFQ